MKRLASVWEQWFCPMFRLKFSDRTSVDVPKQAVRDLESCFQPAAELGDEVIWNESDGSNRRVLLECFG